jgi:hypothetical protein
MAATTALRILLSLNMNSSLLVLLLFGLRPVAQFPAAAGSAARPRQRNPRLRPDCYQL